MKFSESWLREWVNPNIETDELVSQLTMAGIEIDGIEAAAGEFCGVVVAEILSVEPHPDAEKLRVCIVKGHADGDKQIVCGAKNARTGIKIPFATIGAVLPEGFKIKKAKLRGVESFGMLCGQTELQAGDDDSGLWELPNDAPVGEDLRKYLNLDDSILELDLTPNRGDCLSIRGLAREVGVLNQCEVTEQEVVPVVAAIEDRFPVALSADGACPCYAGRVIRGVDVGSKTPLWMIEKLRRGGIRSIDAVVDVTNYVLLELGQPMHAFDLDTLKSGVKVRFAGTEEKLVLLNDQTIELKQGSLVIADETGPIALAGIMGGASTAVSGSTNDLFLEAAFFDPIAIAGKARSYGLHTDSSHRFERGVDSQLQIKAMERATQLLLDIAGGRAGPISYSELPEYKPEVKSVHLTKDRLIKGLSLDLALLDVSEILTRLGLTIVSEDELGWHLDVPSYRFDIDIEEDLLEEVARIYGYDKLPTRPLMFSSVLESHTEIKTPLSAIKRNLVGRGYQEVITYSFIDPKAHNVIHPDIKAIQLKNPISADMSSMRVSLVSGLMQSLQYNFKRQHVQAKLFEAGMVFIPNLHGEVSETIQKRLIAGVISGSVHEASWAEASRDADFYDIKGDLENTLSACAFGASVAFEKLNDAPAHLHPGQAARVSIEGVDVGYVGALHPSLQKTMGFTKSVYLFECEVDLISEAKLPKFSPLSKHPEVSRDLAVLVDKQCCVADIDTAIRKAAGSVLKQLTLFDVYSGEGIDTERKSLAFSLTFQHPLQTLKDDEINASMSSVINSLESQFNASLR